MQGAYREQPAPHCLLHVRTVMGSRNTGATIAFFWGEANMRFGHAWMLAAVAVAGCAQEEQVNLDEAVGCYGPAAREEWTGSFRIEKDADGYVLVARPTPKEEEMHIPMRIATRPELKDIATSYSFWPVWGLTSVDAEMHAWLVKSAQHGVEGEENYAIIGQAGANFARKATCP